MKKPPVKPSLIVVTVTYLGFAGTSLAEGTGATPSAGALGRSDSSEQLIEALVAQAVPCEIRTCTLVCQTKTMNAGLGILKHKVTTCAEEKSCLEHNHKCTESIASQEKEAIVNLFNKAAGHVLERPIKQPTLSPSKLRIANALKISRKVRGAWVATADTKCNIGAGIPYKISLEECQAACSAGCPFFMYNPKSPYSDNCWIADNTKTISKNCAEHSGGWTLYTRRGATAPISGTDMPGMPASGADMPGMPASGADMPAMPASGADMPAMPASQADMPGMPGIPGDPAIVPTSSPTQQPTSVKRATATVPGSWVATADTKCNIGAGIQGHISLEECQAACSAGCPFFMYNPKSRYPENCWTADNTKTIGKYCFAQSGGWTLYTRQGANKDAKNQTKKGSNKGGCADTPGWFNGWHGANGGRGWSCAQYVSKHWCKNGARQAWTLGARFKYPERNCCACGKPAGAAKPKPTPRPHAHRRPHTHPPKPSKPKGARTPTSFHPTRQTAPIEAPIEGNSHCPDGFDSPGLKRHDHEDEGDICRNKMFSSVRSGANVDWACPESCVISESAPPWCKRSGSSSEPCRVPGAYRPKRCQSRSFYEVSHSELKRLWARELRTNDEQGIRDPKWAQNHPNIKTANACAGKTGHRQISFFVWNEHTGKCQTNIVDPKPGGKHTVYCWKRKRAFLTDRSVANRGDIMDRPTWITTQRCSSTACTSCGDKDDGETGCWRFQGSNWYRLDVGPDSDLTYSVITITLKCLAGESLPFWLKTKGNVTMYWNGVKKYQIIGDDRWDVRNQRWWGIDGDNEVMVVFTRQAKVKAEARVWISAQFVRPDFTKCEDVKACLGKAKGALGETWNTAQSKALRLNITNQHLCLNDRSQLGKERGHAMLDVCDKWTECLKNSSRLEDIKQTVAALGGSTVQPLETHTSPHQSSGALTKNITPTLPPGLKCRNPFLIDPESWDCACHATMVEKCELKDCGKDKDCFKSCYRTQLCNDKKVCPEWKRKVCTEFKDCKTSDNDGALTSALGKMTKLNSVPETVFQRHTCKGLASNCRHEEIGAIVRHHCPWTCGMCHLYPYTSPIESEANLELDDAVAGKANARGWTLTPRSTMTHTPTADQSCFVDPDAFDCNCYAAKQRFCGNENAREMHHLRHPADKVGNLGKVYSAAECEHFFVCTHSQTCQKYKTANCMRETKLLKELKAKKRKIETC